MDVISQWWPYLLAAVVVGAVSGYWMRRTGARAETGSDSVAAEEADAPHQTPAGNGAGHEQEMQRAEHTGIALVELRQEHDRLQADFSRRIGELEAQLRDRDERIARMTDTEHGTRPARVAFSSEPAISREEVDTLFAEIIEARAAMKAAEQEARQREEAVAAELAEAYAELQAASAAIRAREGRLSEELEEARRELQDAADRLAATHAVEQSLRGELEQSLAAENSARKQAQELLEDNARLSIACREMEARLISSMQNEQAARAVPEANGSDQVGHGRDEEQQAVTAELRAQLTEARGRLAAMAEDERRLREELAESRRLGDAAAKREAAIGLELDRVRQRPAEARAATPVSTDQPPPPAAHVHRLPVAAPDEARRYEAAETEGADALSPAAGLVGEELERLVLAAGEGRKPAGRELADGQQPDDLKAIGGIGPVNERWLHRNGIYSYTQIAQWTPQELAWVARHLPNFGRRVYRENWARQAAELVRLERLPRQGERLSADRY
ncbi:MAG: 50S ribosomal protein L21 [Gammaproteobacteria bacterium]|nr:50S ribosomal protein L21 [Gammaproteobacteria bacterium]